MDEKYFDMIFDRLYKSGILKTVPVVSDIAVKTKDPYKVLVSCILSLRTKDEVTREASRRLFYKASTPYDMVKLDVSEIERLIYPVGFYRNKARIIKNLSSEIINRFSGRVPDNMSDLLSLKGVGRKTANLVLIEGFDKDGICVDTHVHRICNRLGWFKTKNPDETEMRLREVLPKKYWKIINRAFVEFGKKICKPVSPLCSGCPLNDICKKVGVKVFR